MFLWFSHGFPMVCSNESSRISGPFNWAAPDMSSERPQPDALRVCDSAAWYIYIQGRWWANESLVFCSCVNVLSDNQTWLAGKSHMCTWSFHEKLHLVRGFSSQPRLIARGYGSMFRGFTVSEHMVPFGNLTWLWKITIYSGFFH